jgi:enoyl-CoA hydratase/carnithine racemase
MDQPLPTIACLSGPAFGWGLELALACDLRVAHPASLLCLPETSLGIFPGAGGVVLLRELVSPSIAKDLIFTARRFSGADALSLGVVNRVSPNVEENAEELAQCIAENGPLGVRGAKEVMEGAHNVDFGTAIALARQLRAPLSETEDFKEALQAFEEKRKPTFRGR